MTRYLTLLFLLLIICGPINAQSRSFQGNWNWAEYATDKSELPPAYHDMDLKEVPRYAVDLTIKQRGNKISGSFGIVARYLARVDEGSFSGVVKGSTVTIRVKSNFGGSATIQLTLRHNQLIWKSLRTSGQMYFPDAIELRRLKPGEKPPYVVDDADYIRQRELNTNSACSISSIGHSGEEIVGAALRGRPRQNLISQRVATEGRPYKYA